MWGGEGGLHVTITNGKKLRRPPIPKRPRKIIWEGFEARKEKGNDSIT